MPRNRGRVSLKTSKRHHSATRMLRIGETLADATRPLSAAEVAQRAGLDPSTTHRLLQNLASDGYAIREERTKRYVASPRLLYPVSPYHPWSVVRRDATSTLLGLRDATGYSAALIVFCLGQRILLEFAPGRDPMIPSFGTWITTPLHASGSGKVLLMGLGGSERLRLLGPGPFEQMTEHTITDPQALEEELNESARRGYVLSCDEQILGLRTIAVPVLSPSGVIVGALLLYGRSTHLRDEVLEETARVVKESTELFAMSSPSLNLLEDLAWGSTTTNSVGAPKRPLRRNSGAQAISRTRPVGS